VYCNEVPVAQWRLMPGMILAQGALGEHLRALGTSGVPADVVPGVAASTWVPEQHGDALKRIGIVTLPGIEALGEYLRAVLDAHAADFLGLQETCGLLSSLDSLCPDLIKEVDRAMPKPRIADVLQRLVSEGIPIRNLKGVLETLTKWGQKEKDPVVLTEYVRADMKRQISHKFTGGGNVLTAYLLAPRLEETLRGAIRQTSAGSYVVLEPHETKLLLDTVKLAVGDLKNRQVLPVLLTAMDIRRYLRKLIEQDCPELAVLAYQELTPEISVQAVGRIDLPSYR
jgi:type III secretion protein V